MARYDYYRMTPYHMVHLPGNGGTTPLLTPQAGTGSETKTHTTTLDAYAFGGRKVRIKKFSYVVTTAQTGAGCNLALDLYVGTTSKAALSLTTEAAGTIVSSTTEIDEVVEADSYVRVLAKSTTTASGANSAKGFLQLTYEEMFL